MRFVLEFLAVTPATVFFAECLIRSPLLEAARAVSATASKSMRVVSSRRISEHWKEAVLPRYSRVLFVRTCVLFLWLIACVGAFAIAFWAAEFLNSGQLRPEQLVPSFSETILATVVGVLYGIIRIRHG